MKIGYSLPFTPDAMGYLYEPEYTNEELIDLERAERGDREKRASSTHTYDGQNRCRPNAKIIAMMENM